jgi:hypothetical protein
VEVYTVPFTVTLTSAYTAGNTSLAVSAAAPAAIQTGTFRVRLSNTSGTLLKVTAGAATTTWTVVAEANDASAVSGSIVYGCEITAGMIDQIRSEQIQTGIFSGYTAQKNGNLYLTTDAGVLVRDTGSSLAYWGPIYPLTPPPSQSTLTWVNQGTATAVDINGGILLTAPANAGDSLRCLFKTMPATPYTFTILFDYDGFSSSFTGAGIAIRDSASGKIVTFMYSFLTSYVYGTGNWNSATSNSSSTTFPFPPGGKLFLDIGLVYNGHLIFSNRWYIVRVSNKFCGRATALFYSTSRNV